MTGCGGNKQYTEDFITVDLTASYPNEELILQDFMDVEYIPLETTDEFITTAYVQDLGKDVIIVRNRNRSSDGDIFFFDRNNGKSLKKINRQGQGPEEYVFLLKVIIDEDNDEIFVNDHQSKKIFVYDLSGKFKRSFKHKEGSTFDPIYIFDQNNLICIDYIGDFYEELRNKFFIISKHDGSVTNEIYIPYENKISTILQVFDEERNINYAAGARNEELVPLGDSWMLADPSSDTIYKLLPDGKGILPFISRTPSIQSMEKKIFLFPGVITDRYCFMQAVKKEYDFATGEGFPRTDLMYDKEEKKIFRSTVYNDDYSEKKIVNMVYGDITLMNNEVTFIQKLEAYELVDAYEKGKLKNKLKEIAAELKEDSNPVIMIAKYKK
jgi:hypothetical protein